MSGDKILYLDYEWTGDDIESGNCYIANDLVGDQLAIDTFEFTISSKCLTRVYYETADDKLYETADGKLYLVKYSDEDLTKYSYGTPVLYYNNDVLIGKFYVTFVKRSGLTSFTFTCVSAIGLLDNMPHYGGLYDGETVGEILEALLGGIIEYTVDPEVEALPVYGLLPAGDRRELLHMLLFAEGVRLAKNADGTMHFTFLTADEISIIPDDRFYDDGEVNFDAPITRAVVYEHSYTALSSDPVVTLFDNTDGSGVAINREVIFDKGPCHDLVTTGTLTIVESGVNYAILNGTGVLTGKTITHQVTTTSRSIPGATVDRVYTVDDNTLISVANSESVAQRILSYYSSAKTIPGSLVVGSERPGARVRFNDPYDDEVEGFLQSLDINLGRSTLKAAAQFVTDYEPTGHGNFYTDSILLTGTGEWVAPDKYGDGQPYTIRVVVFQAGSGGNGGHPGASSVADTTGQGGEGGAAGLAGKGGKILNVPYTVTPGHTYAFNCGVGGSGGTQGNLGEEGGETTFADVTSADGARFAGGFKDVFTGDIYGTDGIDGVAGGAGCGYWGGVPIPGPDVVFNGVTYHPGTTGVSAYNEYLSVTAFPGGGGGAAVGGTPGNGADGTFGYPYGVNYYAIHGYAGAGANAIAGSDATDYGQGGNGGHGGGGGGFRVNKFGTYQYQLAGQGGGGGAGSKGGKGGNGAVLIYI